MIEGLNVCLSWVSKCWRASGTRRFRLIGFWLALAISCVWLIFFWHQEMYWLSLNAIVTAGIDIRGIKNNMKVMDDKRTPEVADEQETIR